MVLIFTAGNRHLFKVIFFKLKSAWILLILAAERGGGEREAACPVFVRLSAGCRGEPVPEGSGFAGSAAGPPAEALALERFISSSSYFGWPKALSEIQRYSQRL